MYPLPRMSSLLLQIQKRIGPASRPIGRSAVHVRRVANDVMRPFQVSGVVHVAVVGS